MVPLVTYFVVMYRVVPEEMNISGKILIYGVIQQEIGK